MGASRVKPEADLDEDQLSVEFHDILYQNMVELPPLRGRERDIELLARHFLRDWAMDHGVPVPVLETKSIEAMYAYPWPGNVRELRNALERAATLAPGRRIGPEHLRIKARRNAPLHGEAPSSRDMILIPPEGKRIAQIEAEAVRATLKLTAETGALPPGCWESHARRSAARSRSTTSREGLNNPILGGTRSVAVRRSGYEGLSER